MAALRGCRPRRPGCRGRRRAGAARRARCSRRRRAGRRGTARRSVPAATRSMQPADRALAKAWRAWRSSPSRRSNWPSASHRAAGRRLAAAGCRRAGRLSASWPTISPAYMRSKPNCHEFASSRRRARPRLSSSASSPHATRARRSQRSSASRPSASIAKRRATAGTSRKSSTSLTVKRLSARSSTCANALISGCARASPTSARCQGMCSGSLRYCAGSPNTAAR